MSSLKAAHYTMKFHSIVLLVLASTHANLAMRAAEDLSSQPSKINEKSSKLDTIKDIGGYTLLAGAFVFSLPLSISALYAANNAYISLCSPHFLNHKEEACTRGLGQLGQTVFFTCLAGCAACSYGSYKLLDDEDKVIACLSTSAALQGTLWGTFLLGGIIDKIASSCLSRQQPRR